LTNIHLADAQAIRIRVLLCRHDLTDNDTRERWGDRALFFNFQTTHGERFGQLGSGQWWVAKFAQPRFWELHS
jgi:hypothetical protein